MSKRAKVTVDRQCAAIICAHAASGSSPILLAERSEPEDSSDSGWQFLCGAEDEEWSDAQVWSVQEVVDSDGTLAELVDMPAGTRISRPTASDSWEVVPKEQDRH